MEHLLSELPWPKSGLQPHISEETITYHHDKHHAAYVKKLNALIKGTEFEDMSLEDIIVRSKGDIFNNAAQAWNHDFFWNCLSPEGGGGPTGKLKNLIDQRWKNFEHFREEFTKKAIQNFGSGWTWLVQAEDGSLDIMNTSNANDPLPVHLRPLLTVDVWEHAYYIDYRNERAKFLESFWNVVNWKFAEQNLEKGAH